MFLISVKGHSIYYVRTSNNPRRILYCFFLSLQLISRFWFSCWNAIHVYRSNFCEMFTLYLFLWTDFPILIPSMNENSEIWSVNYRNRTEFNQQTVHVYRISSHVNGNISNNVQLNAQICYCWQRNFFIHHLLFFRYFNGTKVSFEYLYFLKLLIILYKLRITKKQ